MASEYEELLGFLKDTRVDVQQASVEAVLSCTEDQGFLEYCQQNPRAVARPLMRLVEKEDADVRAGALQALVNTSGVPQICKELVELKAGSRCIEVIKAGWLEGQDASIHLFTMLLQNLTTEETGRQAFVDNPSDLMFMLSLYTGERQPKGIEGYSDRLLWIGKILQNVFVLQSARKLMSQNIPALQRLARELSLPSHRHRRLDVVTCFKNICVDEDMHGAVVDSGFFRRVACLLYPEGEDEERRKALPEAVLQALQGFTGDQAVRMCAAESLLGLVATTKGREHLRENGGYELLRAWHLKETHEQTRTIIEEIVPMVHHTEAELEQNKKEATSQSATSGWLPTAKSASVPGASAGYSSVAPKAHTEERPKEPPRSLQEPLPKQAVAKSKEEDDEDAKKGLEDLGGLFDGITSDEETAMKS